jgi:serine/threonine-protein kinase ATR
MWISNFCRWMITCARACALSRWNDLFFACRTAVRTKSGLEVAEFLLPLLVLDRVCFGNAQDEETIRQEIVFVLDFKASGRVIMNQTERQKAVNVVLTVVDTLRFWAERETEERHKSSRATPAVSVKGARRPLGDLANSSNWPADEALNRIAEVLDTIPLSLQADAAVNVGMHARSLRLLEMAARQHVVDQIFNSDSESVDDKPGADTAGLKMVGQHFTMGVNLNLMKDVFAQLDDSETLAAVGEEFSFADPSAHVRDSIRRKEASGDWEAALQEYERALQLEGDERRDPMMERGSLQCLLEIGQFESVLNQVTGLMRRQHQSPGTKVQASNAIHVLPLAIEAAWRLGRWNTLSDLVDDDESDGGFCKTLDDEACYQIAVGRAMLGLHRKDVNVVGSGLKNARRALMQSLSSVARESYARSYALIVRLQCLRELENSVDLLCKRSNAQSSLTDCCQLNTHEGWGWDGRLAYVSAQGSTAVINTRLALARLAGEPSLEGSLFLNLGRKARKSGLYTVAANYFSQAEAKFAGMTSIGEGANSQVSDSLDRVRTQFAKLKHATGESSTALKILGQDGMQRSFDQMIIDRDNLSKVQGTALRYEKQRIGSLATSNPGIGDEDKALMQRFAGRFLKLTQWMAEGGLKGGAEIMGRYRFVHMLSPEWEKGN